MDKEDLPYVMESTQTAMEKMTLTKMVMGLSLPNLRVSLPWASQHRELCRLRTLGFLPADVITVQEGVEDYTISGLDVLEAAGEQYYDGIDQDCGGDNDFDQDGDGFIPDLFVGVDTQIEGDVIH